MRTVHTFTVPETRETVRRLIDDVDRAVACVPGLTVESAAPGEYGGRLRVRAGSTTVTYRGSARVTSKAGDTTTIELDGQEARGAGTVKGVLTVTLDAEGSAATQVTIGADATVTGRLGDLDATVLADVVQRLLGRFGECVTAAVAEEPVEPSLAEGAASDAPAQAASDAPAQAAPAATAQAVPAATDAAAEDSASAPAAHRTRPLEPRPDDLLAPAAQTPSWPLRQVAPFLAALAVIGVVVRLFRRRARRVR